MWQVSGFEGRILADWERCKTEKGVSYYIHHGSKRTQWDHPLLVEVMEEILGCNVIKYAAYRTASKMRILQKFTKLHLVTLSTIISSFDQHGYGLDHNDIYIFPDELEVLLSDVFHMTKRNQPSQAETKLLAEISMNLLMNFYDTRRRGMIKVCHAKAALTLLSAARLQEKYKYLFRQFADHNNNSISKKKLVELLKCFAEMTEYLSEKPSFGSQLVNATFESYFQSETNSVGITEESFLEWLMCEPQTLVWISTIYRLSTSESVEHEVKCSFCKINPIIGLRYQCLRCFHYNLCQQCFFKGHANKQHKLYHPIQEYCSKSTSKQGTKALMTTIKNKCSKKTTSKSKQRYLPISPDAAVQDDKLNTGENEHNSSPADENQQTATTVKVSKMLQTDSLPQHEISAVALHSSTIGYDEHQTHSEPENANLKELESIILHLEDENMYLLKEIERLRKTNVANAMGIVTNGRQEHIIARQIALEDHNHQLEVQLKRLKSLHKYFQATPQTDQPAINLKSRITFLSPRMESTPIGKYNKAKFKFTTPKNEGFGSATAFRGVNIDSDSSSPCQTMEWERPFGNQSGFARRSLPCSSFQRSYNSPGTVASSAQRASARAVLQSTEFSTTASVTTQSESCSSVTGAYKKLPNAFHMIATSSRNHKFNELSTSLPESSQPRIDDDTIKILHPSFLATTTSDGLNRIQAELDAIIRQLETVYPGCSQKSEVVENSEFTSDSR